MKTATTKPVKRLLDRSLEATPVSPSLATQALASMRARRLDLAWLWADKLCRTSAGSALGDAYLLRSAVFALQGNRASAETDLAAAAEVDPDAPALNRTLLASPRANERLAAARRLLRAADTRDRNHGFAALARMNVACIGLLELTDGGLAAQLVWNGPETIRLLVRTDTDKRWVRARSGSEPRPPGFEHAGRIDIALPRPARIATVMAPDLNSLFEPTSLLLPLPDPVPRHRDLRPTSDEPLIVVPVYVDRKATLACLESLFACSPKEGTRNIVVVDDASPDRSLSASLDELAANGRIRLLRNTINMGFAGSVNRALPLRQPGQDSLLLNSDTVVPPGAIEGLARHIRNSSDVGTATPLSNNGEDTSFPIRFRSNPMPDASAIAALQETAARVNAGQGIDMPNGVGFCLYVRGELCDRLGPLSHRFGRGYYEDVEFCLKVAEAGYRNICATDVYVGHHGSRSFAHGKRALVVRNLRRVNAAHPSYLAMARAFEAADPLREPIGRVEEELLRETPDLDLLLLPFDTPTVLAKAIVSGLASRSRNLIAVRLRCSESGLELAFAGANGAIPQNMAWRFAADTNGENELAQRLSGLPIRSATMLDFDRLPQVVVGTVSKLAPDQRWIVAHLPVSSRLSCIGATEKDRPVLPLPAASILAVTPAILAAAAATHGSSKVELLTVPQLPWIEPPRLSKGSGVLAVVGAGGADEDLALLEALAQAPSCTDGRPSVVVAGALNPEAIASLPPTIHVAGRIDDEELPVWLTRLGPQALFFADRIWGMADPRAATWAEAGIATARFDWRSTKAREDGHCLLLPRDGTPGALASAIAAWLSSAQS